MSEWIRQFSQHEQINFLLTNRIPRHLLTRLMGWFSEIENPALTKISIAIWKLFASDLNFEEAENCHYRSLQQCFTRRLKKGARVIDARPNIITSPCDAIIGSCGRIEESTVYQAKGFPYQIQDLIPDPAICRTIQNGSYVTLRLKSSMYHRFHAPVDGNVNDILYLSGDTWNVNPVALKKIEKLYCKNERAVLEIHPTSQAGHLVMVPVAAILVASMKFHCLDQALDLRYQGINRIPCFARYKKGEEMGYFQHGSTIILFASSHFELLGHIRSGDRINMGQALLQQRANQAN